MSDEPFYLVFGKGKDGWSAPNPRRYEAGNFASAYYYLALLCPDTKTALSKLRQIRAEVKRRAASRRDTQ